MKYSAVIEWIKDKIFLRFPSTPRIDIVENITKLTMTELRKDQYGNEYILLSENKVDFSTFDSEIKDKTEFESVQNHVHVLDRITKKEYESLQVISKPLCQSVLDILCSKYPNRSFFVYATVSLHDSFILRFHQAWQGEPPYYDENISFLNEWVYCIHN